jgi:serine/threonine protein phosphatase PrpC
VARNPWDRGLGSTLTFAQVVWPRLYLMHVGDCRCYLCRDSKIECLTADQIVDGTLAERGVVSDESRLLRRRTLWSFIGDNGRNLNPQVSETELRIGDTLVLCTRGLVQGVSDRRISELLDNDISAEEACRQLVAAAHDVGGIEDMTVIVVRFRDQLSSIDAGLRTNSAISDEPGPDEDVSNYWIDRRHSAIALRTWVDFIGADS